MASEKRRISRLHHVWTLSAGSVALLGLAGACDAPEPPEAPALVLCCDGRGACLPTTLFTERDASRLERGNCRRDYMCVPDAVRGPDPPRTCSVASTGAEGRCLPSCLPDVGKNQRWLARDGCAKYERCVPCYDPTTGEATSACDLAGDAGPRALPTTFDWCCGNAGRCVPSSLLTDDEQDGLGADTCAGNAALCVPADAVKAGNDYVPPSCVTEAYGAEGRCLPSCLPDVARRAHQLRADGCARGSLCAPCFDPLTSEATGACDRGADPGPTESPVAFDVCCGGAGHCIPPELVPADQQSHLGMDACTEPSLCVPDSLSATADVTLGSCTVARTGAEGRCAPSCLPEVVAHATRLSQDGCSDGSVCAPCFDPVSGDPTGVCSVGDDRGPTERPVIFESCCGDVGRCVPGSLLMDDERDGLGADSCTGDGTLCVPADALEAGDDYVPPSCVTEAYGAEGRCLPSCLPDVARRAHQLREDGCAAGSLCVPCFDPLTSEATGACDRGADAGPTGTPVSFDACCSGAGHCIPSALVPRDERSHLDAEDCTARSLCVPDSLSAAADVTLARCTVTLTGAEGRCAPSCLPDVAAHAASLSRDGCDDGNLCAPCFDPLSGDPTGVCSVGEDRGPTARPVIFETCCGGLARCLPSTLVPDAQRAGLGKDSCRETTDLCVPSEALADPPRSPERCAMAAGGVPGICLLGCLPALAPLAGLLSEETCSPGYLCVPCVDPATGAPSPICQE